MAHPQTLAGSRSAIGTLPDSPASPAQAGDPSLPSAWTAFEGEDSTWLQAHPDIAIGPSHVVAAANDAIDFWTKDGDLSIPGPHISFSTWFADLLSTIPAAFALIEPQLHYDAFAERYVFTVAARNDTDGYSLVLVSISRSSDPTAGWCDYAFAPSYFDGALHSMPMGRYSFTVDDNQLVLAANLDAIDAYGWLGFDSSRALYLSKSLYFGTSCVPVDDQVYAHGEVLAAGGDYDYLHAATNVDEPGQITLVGSNRSFGDTIRLWQANTRADGLPGFTGSYRSRTVALGSAYRYPPDAQQPGTSSLVYTGFAEVASAVVRNGLLAAVHSIGCELPGDSATRSCTSWYEIDLASGEVVGSRGYGAVGGYHSFPEVMLDECDRSLIVFNFSSSADFQSVAYTDPEEPSFYIPSTGAGRGCLDNRSPSSAGWGFGNGIALDPTSGTIWGHAAHVGDASSDCTANDWDTLTFEVDWDRCSTAPGPGGGYCPGESFSGTLDVTIPPAPARADVLFAFDTTGSMSLVLDGARDNVRTIIADLEAVIPDLALGVIDFKDYPVEPFGWDGDWPYRLLQPLTVSRTSVEAALDTMVAEGGGDGPEAYTRVLYESYADPSIGWRSDARRFLVMFGDHYPHDNNLNEGIAAPIESPGGTWCGFLEPDCVLDPGRDGAPGTADDLDLQATLDEVRFADITLLFVGGEGLTPTEWTDTLVDYWGHWAARTGAGGTSVALEDVDSLSPTLRTLIMDASSRIGRLALETSPPGYGSWITPTPREYTDLIIPRAGRRVSFDYEVRVPPGTTVGRRYTFELRAVGDGAVYEPRRDIVVDVPASCAPGPDPTPTVPPPSGGRFAMVAVNRDFRHEWLRPGRYTARGGPLSDIAASGIIVQNLDRRASLDAVAQFIRQDVPYERDPAEALEWHEIEVPRLGPGGIGVLYLPGLDIPRGTYSTMFRVDPGRNVAGIVRTDWTDSGGAGLYRNVTPSDKLVLPLVVRNYYGQTSVISLLSDENRRPVDIEIAFFETGSSTPVAVYVEEDVRQLEGLTYDLNDNIAEFDALGDGFLGSATITMVDGAGNRRTDARVGAVSHINIATSDLAISAFEAMPVGSEYSAAASVVYAPLWRSRQRGPGGALLDTGISVVNPNVWPVDVDLTYYATRDATASAACRDMRPRTFTALIEGFSSHVFYQGPGGDTLPDNCFGSAIIESYGGDVLAIVNDSQNLIDIAAAYNAVPIQEAHTEVAVPMWRNHYTPALLTTGIQVMNVGRADADVHIDFLSTDGSLIPGCIRDCDVTIGPNESHTWWPPALASLPKGLVGGIGSALIESTEPVVAIVNDYPIAGGVDAATYNATPNFNVTR